MSADALTSDTTGFMDDYTAYHESRANDALSDLHGLRGEAATRSLALAFARFERSVRETVQEEMEETPEQLVVAEVTREHRLAAIIALRGDGIARIDESWAEVGGDYYDSDVLGRCGYPTANRIAHAIAEAEASASARLREQLESAHGLVESLQRELRSKGGSDG